MVSVLPRFARVLWPSSGKEMTQAMNILFLEDVATDAELAGHEVQEAGIRFISRRVDNREQFLRSLADFRPDLILADYSLPSFDGLSALAIAREHCPDTPFIFVSGSMGEEFAIDTLKRGATDYVLKNNLKRLGPAVQRALQEKAERQALRVAEAQRVQANERLGLALDASNIAVWDFDLRTGNVYLSNQWAAMLGEEPKESYTTVAALLEIAHPDDRESFSKLALDTMKGLIPAYQTQHRVRARSGQWKWIASRGKVAERDAEGRALRMIGTNADITELKRAEELALQQFKLSEAFFSHSVASLVILDRSFNFLRVNEAYAKACRKDIGDFAGHNHFDLYPSEYKAIFEDVVRTKRPFETFTRPFTFPDQPERGVTYWDWTLFPILDQKGEVEYLVFSLNEVTERKKSEDQSKQYLTQLEKAMLGTVDAVSRMLELRDPYTSGHQSRVAHLAAAIGAELGMSTQEIQGLRVAGNVHDIGKISCPAEILSKPTKLSALEYEIIKTHPQQGYEILKSIEFPWPVAPAVLQHHERMGGSGYPSGLKGDQISIYARILAVADTVEAMASHRPYRPGLGIDAAMEEIESHLATQYDSVVGRTCLRLFREKNYRLADPSR